MAETEILTKEIVKSFTQSPEEQIMLPSERHIHNQGETAAFTEGVFSFIFESPEVSEKDKYVDYIKRTSGRISLKKADQIKKIFRIIRDYKNGKI